MKNIIYISTIVLSLFVQLQAQELNVKLTINTQKIQSANPEIFQSLEKDILTLLNEEKWTNATFSRIERIDCNLGLLINEMQNENSFVGEIQLTARRPVYNSTYISSIFNYRDTQFEFSYILGQSLDYSPNNIRENLIAVIAFYANIIVGLDFDSFSLNGGKPYFQRAMDIANAAQTLNTKGWEAFSGSGKGNRYDLALALTDESSDSFHNLWYNYHRTGLDEMAVNPTRGRINVMKTVEDLQKLYEKKPSSPLLILFAESKLDEFVKICSDASSDEKKELKKTLSRIFPTKSQILSDLK